VKERIDVRYAGKKLLWRQIVVSTSPISERKVFQLISQPLVNIDPALINFLTKYFADEVKAKQKLNEKMAAIDEFGEAYVNARCALM
jgi:hypothetical protein